MHVLSHHPVLVKHIRVGGHAKCQHYYLVEHVMNSKMKLLGCCRVAPLSAALALCLSGTALGATITVNDPTGSSVSGSCTIVDAAASLNQGSITAGSNCVNNGNPFGVGDTIVFSANFTITFTEPAGSKSTALVFLKPVTISGSSDANGKPQVTIARSTSSTTQFRLVQSQGNLVLNGLTINGGDVVGDGGGIDMSGNAGVSATNSIISGNVATVRGGGIYANTGAVVLTNSTITGNAAQTYGGGVYGFSPVSVTNSTISGNSSDAQGGGIFSAGGIVSSKSTFSGNQSLASGGGIATFGPSTLTDTTISGNSATSSGGGIYSYDTANLNFCTITANSVGPGGMGGGVVLVGNGNTATGTLISGNTQGNDVDGPFPVLLGGNHDLIGTSGSNITAPGDTITCDPQLGPLSDNGGATLTHSFYAGSCAVDAGPTNTPLLTDQRGFTREMGGATDIGAFEKQNVNDSSDTIMANGFDN